MKLLTFVFLAASCVAADAAVLNVPAQYPTIQEADGAGPGDSVLVAQGAYNENCC